MQAVRQSASRAARRVRPSAPALPLATRSYASKEPHDDAHHDAHHDDHHHAPEVNESPGMALYGALGALAAAMTVYSVSRPAEDGSPSALRQWLEKTQEAAAPKWADRNALRADYYDQAAMDKNLFKSVERSEFRYRSPELLNSGCPNNVPAGHGVHLDHVVEHYRKRRLEQEEETAKIMKQKAERLAAAKKD